MDFNINALPMLSSINSQNNLMQSVGTAMLAKTMDVADSEMASLTKAMELSVNPNLGANLDLSI